jgi:hypothetical protein
MACKVDFFVIGAQKAGTTALASLLAQQPAIQMARIKEVHYFDDEVLIDWNSPDYGRLHRHFDWTDLCVIRGEATPIYMYWPLAMERLFEYNPKARLVIGLRHPVCRAYSQWRMNVSRGQEPLDFETATGPIGRSRLHDGSQSSQRLFSYIERGLYSRQIHNVLGLFPRCQLHFYRTDHLWSMPVDTITNLLKFLQVPLTVSLDPAAVYISPYVATLPKVQACLEHRHMDQMFYDDLSVTQALSGLDLSDWMQSDYTEPMSAVA